MLLNEPILPGAVPDEVQVTAGDTVALGAVLTIDSTPEAFRADATFSVGRWRVIGIAKAAAIATNPVTIVTGQGARVPVLFGSAPAASSNGSLVFLSATAGEAVLAPPLTSGNVRFALGMLIGADGATTTPDVVFSPQYISRRP